MQKHRWHYKTLSELKQALAQLNLHIPFAEDTTILAKPLTLDGKTLHNRIVYQPMEGGDSEPDGTPGEQTFRRYSNFAKGGPGIIWVEAVPVLAEARSNPHQLYLHEKNLDAFKKFVDDMRTECFRENGFNPFIIIQYTHTGRYSHPHGVSAAITAHRNPKIEERFNPERSIIISDDGLKRYEEAMGISAGLAEKAGFDGAEVKCCHGYLAQELLTAYERPGPYGGSFENRTRLFINAIQNARGYTSNSFTITSRINMYDGYPHPWGFGAQEDGTPDLTETLRLTEMLRKGGMKLLNLTSGSPTNFTITCPRDNGPEHPLLGVARMLTLTRKIKEASPSLLIVSSAYSYLREFSPLAMAGSISTGASDLVGYGRMSFAYPNVARDIIAGSFDKSKLCLCCKECGYPCRVRG